MLLTLRQKKILTKILEQNSFVTVSTLATYLAVSTRTIQREFEVIDLYLNNFNASLLKKSGFGVKLVVDDSTRENIINSISKDSKTLGYSKNERQNFILFWLLKEETPIKTYFFKRKLNVTETTIGTDLIGCEKWLNTNGINLIRKQGVGIFIEGTEICIRRAVYKLIISNLDWDKITNKIDNETLTQKLTSQDISGIIEQTTFEQVIKLIDNVKYNYEIFANDHNYINFLINLYVVVLRIKSNKSITINEHLLIDIDALNENSIAKEISNMLSKTFNISISCYEEAYLTMLLIGARSSNKSKIDDKIKSVVDKMINLVEKETGFVLTEATNFYESFLAHFTHAFKRISLGLEITNPFIDNIKECYSHVYNLALLCAKIAEDELNVIIPIDEIGFIAMHLGTALEDKKVRNSRIYKLIVSCPSGMVSSRLLATRLLREFNNILIVESISTTDFDEERFIMNNIDLIVSTVVINTKSIPCIKVSPFLIEAEKVAVKKIIEEINISKEEF